MASFQSAMSVVSVILLAVLVNQSMAIVNRDLMAIDINDILSEKLMPLSLIYVKESAEHGPKNANRALYPLSYSLADFNSAFHLMQFHRKMIQNFKCNKYIARQILTDIAPHTLHNRLGIASINLTGNYYTARIKFISSSQQKFIYFSNNNNNTKKGLVNGVNANDAIDSALLDQGSSAYKSWLTK